MEISAVVCTHNRYDFLPNAIKSLLGQKQVEGQLEIIVVDNSPDRSRANDFALKYEGVGQVRFLYESIQNLSNARNAGAKAAQSDIVAYLDDDAVASGLWARSLLDAFADYGSQAGIVGGPVRPIWIEPPPAWLTKRAGDMFSLVERGSDTRIMEKHEWLAGCNISFDRATLLSSGGFDVALGRTGAAASLLANEEYTVCERIMGLGKQMVFAPNAIVDHVIPADRVNVEWLVRRMAWQAISDAVSHSERSLHHAKVTTIRFTLRERITRAVRYFQISNGLKKSLSDEDLELVYDTVNLLICGGRQKRVPE